MQNNLDIWAIQSQPEELIDALAQIKEDSKENILYTNCIFQMEVGGKSITTKQFNTALMSYDSDVLVMVMQGAKVNPTIIRNYLDYEKIPYTEVNFMQSLEGECTKDSEKELWFARDKEVLQSALEESAKNGVKYCTYYPNIEGSLSFQYLTQEQQIIDFDKRWIKGMLDLEDKTVLLIQYPNYENVTENQVYQVLESSMLKLNVTVNVETDFVSSKSYQKKK